MGEEERRTDPEIDRFLDGLPIDVRSLVLALRHLVRETVPEADESILWGGLSYHVPWIGGRVKGAVCQIGVSHGEVRLEFIHGVRLSDPENLLRGDRLSKRYVPIEGIEDVHCSAIVALLRDAIPHPGSHLWF